MTTPTYTEALRAYNARQRDLARRPLWPAEFKHMAPHSLWMIGYHEAGHAVAATALNYEVRFVEVRGLYLSSGRMQPAPEAYLQGPIADRIAIKLAGGEAEAAHDPARVFDLEFERLDSYDIEESRVMIAADRGVEPSASIVAADLAAYRAIAARLVAAHWPWIGRVAATLVTHRHVSGSVVCALRSPRA
jgi:hypothetical protein